MFFKFIKPTKPRKTKAEKEQEKDNEKARAPQRHDVLKIGLTHGMVYEFCPGFQQLLVYGIPDDIKFLDKHADFKVHIGLTGKSVLSEAETDEIKKQKDKAKKAADKEKNAAKKKANKDKAPKKKAKGDAKADDDDAGAE